MWNTRVVNEKCRSFILLWWNVYYKCVLMCYYSATIRCFHIQAMFSKRLHTLVMCVFVLLLVCKYHLVI